MNARLLLGGVFAPSESGRTYPVADAAGETLGEAVLASRKDVRDAVVAARAAFGPWAAASGQARGRALHRVAEVLGAHAPALVAAVSAAEGPAGADAAVEAALDRWLWYAGWADKVAGTVNAVPGPFRSVTLTEPIGVVGVLAPRHSSLLGLVSVLAPVLAAGCTAVVVASEPRPFPALVLAECLALAGLPAGVVSILTGSAAELGPPLAAHGDVDALDLTGALEQDLLEQARLSEQDGLSAPPGATKALEIAAAENLKRVHRGTETDWAREPGLARLMFACETKSVWQPVGT